MNVYTCNYNELYKILREETIVIFGLGEYFHFYVEESFPYDLRKNIVYFIDNNTIDSSIYVWGRSIPVFKADRLKKEKKCSVIISSTNYMYEMYHQLLELDLSEEINCYIYPLILVNYKGENKSLLKEKIFKNNTEQKIPKVIHSFWFSGQQKPKEYQSCIDSWKRFCPDYKIYEWNMNNYDYTKNSFMNQAIKKKKWAFASDFARLDILYHHGGIYMDMDVELIKSLDDLLVNKAFFTFDVNMDIDLGTFAVQEDNLLIKKIMGIYEALEFSDNPRHMNWFCQPRFIRPVLKDFGLKLNGKTQVIDGMIFLSRNYLSPKDSIIYELSAMSEDTYAIHNYNAGWKEGDYRNRRILNNRALCNLIK